MFYGIVSLNIVMYKLVYLCYICALLDQPKIINFTEVDPVKVEEPFNLFCSAKGFPSPIIVLYKDDEKILGIPEGFDEITHSVTSAKLKDNGTYTCNASSNSRAIGGPFPVATKSVHVIVQGETYSNIFIFFKRVCRQA